jgi:hypothetical protein
VIETFLAVMNNVLKLHIIALQDEVRSQDTVYVIISVAMTKAGRELAWTFFKEKWQELMNRYQVSVLFVAVEFSRLNAFTCFCGIVMQPQWLDKFYSIRTIMSLNYMSLF